MSSHIERIVERLRAAEEDLAREVHAQQRRWRYEGHRGRALFDNELRIARRRLKQSIPAYIRETNLLSLLTAPIAYVREVAARTEQYWCPIKHSRVIPTPHGRYHLFFDYGDAEAYRRKLPAVRHALARERGNTLG